MLIARSAGGAAASVAASVRDEVWGADVLAKAVLQQGAAVSDAHRRRADDVGNRNEKLDVGDLRAAWLAKSGSTAPADAPIAADVGPVVPGSGTMLPLTGRLVDTTPFMAEAPIPRKN